MSNYLNDLPSNWVVSSLGDICNQPQYGFTTSSAQEGSLKLLRTTDITSGEINWDSVPCCLDNPADEAKYLLEDGDIVISRAGSVGVSYLLKTPPRSVFASYLIRFKPLLNRQYFKFFLESPYYWREIEGNKLGIAVPNVNASKLKEIFIPISPEKEQHRIVAKLEELFSELDKGIENLKTAQAQLKVYRQALLKHAFEGKLTARWRADNPDKLETANALLKRIQEEREQRYQQQVDDCEATGKPGSKPKAPKPLAPLTTEELAELPDLPNCWIYTDLAELGDLGRGKSKHRPRNDPRLFGGTTPFLQTGEVKAANRTVRRFTNTYSDFGLQQSKLWPAGTLCITIAANIAETAFLGFPACFPDSVVGFTAFKKIIEPEYVDFFIQAVRTRIEAYAPATAQKNINLETLESLVVPFCCPEEQQQIIAMVEERFSEADQLDQALAASLQQSEALRQSILKKAFSGQLVPQDPTDEPASVLLAHIKAKQSAAPKAKKARK